MPKKKPSRSKAAKKPIKKRRETKKMRARKLKRLRTAYTKEQRELRRPMTAKVDIVGGDPVSWLTQLIYVDALSIPPDKILPPRDDRVDTSDGVPAGELHLLLRQLQTLRDQMIVAEGQHKGQAVLMRNDPEKCRWHEEQEERCGMIARALTAILAVSICDAHSLYGKDVGYYVTADWLVRRTTNL